MKKAILSIIIFGTLTTFFSCEKFLDREPTNVLLTDQVKNDPKVAVAVLSNLYNRLQPFGGLEGNRLDAIDTDEVMWSGGLGANNNLNTRTLFPNSIRQYYDYNLVRDLNIFIEDISSSEKLTTNDKNQFIAEARFIRAYVYFLMVRSMGGCL